MKKQPCINHPLAFHNFNVPELKGMEKHNCQFIRCKKCGWVIRDDGVTKVVYSNKKAYMMGALAGLLLALVVMAYIIK